MILNQKGIINKPYLTISVLGKSLKLEIKYRNHPLVELDQSDETVKLYLPKKYKTMEKTMIINMAIEKMYNEIAENEIESAMEEARLILGFAPEDYRIERMSKTFCKCEKNKVIVINPDIVKYSRKIITTTIIQAFCKAEYKINSKAYKEALELGIEKYDSYKFRVIKSSKKIKEKAI
jgi:predicted metal-dependent hydrolase